MSVCHDFKGLSIFKGNYLQPITKLKLNIYRIIMANADELCLFGKAFVDDKNCNKTTLTAEVGLENFKLYNKIELILLRFGASSETLEGPEMRPLDPYLFAS